MINGFEKQTEPLSDKDREAMALIVPHLKAKRGKAAAVTNSKMRKGIERVHGIKISSARMRKIISHIRLNAIIPRLASNSKGYYVEPDDAELQIYIESLEERAASIVAVARALTLQTKGYEQGSLLVG